MLGLKHDETYIENLYEDYKSFIKINPFSWEFPVRADEVHPLQSRHGRADL